MTRPERPSAIPLMDGWSVWPWMRVRGAGFPARGVLELAADDAADAADRLRIADQEIVAMQLRARDELRAQHAAGTPLASAALGALRQLERGRLPRPDAELDVAAPALATARALTSQRSAHLQALEDAYAAAAHRSGAALLEVARDPRFREAVLWQSRGALRTGVDWLLAHPTATNNDARKTQLLVASYLQRYSVKNDSIGFFGPLGWGEVTDAPVALAGSPGRGLLRARRVSFEHWAIDAVAAAISAEVPIRPFLAPRLSPSCALDGTTLRYGLDRTTQLPPVVARVLASCDGITSAQAIAATLAADPRLELESAADVLDMLEELAERKLVHWGIELGGLVAPERELRALLDRIDEPTLRARALAPLDRLEQARTAVAEAAGDLARLDPALAEIDRVFEAVTGRSASRNAGQTYAGRTPVFEDCTRDLTLELGRSVLDRLGPVLALVAHSARWYTHELAARYRAALHDLHQTLVAGGPGPVSYARFLSELGDLLPAQGRSRIIVDLEDELAARWTRVLGITDDRADVDVTVAAIADRVHAEFAAPAPGWPGARHVTPDVMIAAPSLAAVAAGSYTLVLGEVHLANTLLSRLTLVNGPDDDDTLRRAADDDLPAGRVAYVVNRANVGRAQLLQWSPTDFDLESGATISWRPRAQVLRIADLVVEPRGASLVVRDTRAGHVFDIIAFLERQLQWMVSNHFKPGPRGGRLPRVTIGGVVTSRAQWQFTGDQLPAFAAMPRGALQFAAARAWAHAQGLPRWLFARIPEETKPVYVDLASPIYVEMLAKLVRRTTRLTVSEMMPSVADTWLPDADGQTYTSELRLVLVDPEPWRNPLEHAP